MRKLKYANIFLVLLILSIPLTACTNWDTMATERGKVFSSLQLQTTRMEQSQKAVDANQGKFPAHYTKKTESSYASAKQALTDMNGSETVIGWMQELDDAIAKKDGKIARQRLGQIQEALKKVSAYTELILGPPNTTGQGLYEVLQAKVDQLHTGFIPDDNKDLFEEVQALDAPTLATIQAAKATNPFYLCGSTTQMSYKVASSDYGSGLASYKEAEGYFAQEDLPAASDALVEARNSFNSAVGSVDKAEDNHKSAVNAIDAAESSKTLADAAVLMIWADYWSNVSSERSSGIDDLASAQTECESEDFANAVTYAEKAKSHFDDAVYWSTQEAPDPVVESDDDDDSSIWPDSGGGSDDGSWYDSGDDGGSWDSGGDDGGSWDSGGDDGGSWDDGGSDDGSWDAIFLRREEIQKLLQPLFEWIQK